MIASGVRIGLHGRKVESVINRNLKYDMQCLYVNNQRECDKAHYKCVEERQLAV